MRTVPLPQGSVSNLSPEDQRDASLPPDAAIRANAEIIRQAGMMGAMGTLGAPANTPANAPRTGLNIVINGSNPGVPRAPQQISSLNGNDLAALATAGTSVAAAASSEEKSPEETPPEEPGGDANAPDSPVGAGDAANDPQEVSSGTEGPDAASDEQPDSNPEPTPEPAPSP